MTQLVLIVAGTMVVPFVIAHVLVRTLVDRMSAGG